MQNWTDHQLKDVADINCRTVDKNYPYEEIVYYDTASVTANQFQPGQPMELRTAPSRAKRLIQPGDTIISTVRPIQRHYGFITQCEPNAVVSSGFAVVTPRTIDPRFLYYYLTQDRITVYLNTIAESSVSTFPSFRPEVLGSLNIRAPKDLGKQKAIAEILSSLDDKIELNNQINQNLEALAQAIFKRWFVDFEFPDENGQPYKSSGGEMVESELGEIPANWQPGRLATVVTLRKSSVKPFEYPEDQFHHYSIPAFDDGQHPVLEYGRQIKSSKFTVVPSSVLVSKLNPRTPRIWPILHPQENAICSTEFLVFEPVAPEYFEFFYGTVASSSFINSLVGMASGTSGSHQRVRPDDILNSRCILPPNDVVKRFHLATHEIFAWMENKVKENQTLSALRDSLLPRLLSGELELLEETQKKYVRPTPIV